MLRHHYAKNEHGQDVCIKVEEAEPKCGEDFCDRCGECLACTEGWELKCLPEYKEHLWIVYEEDLAAHAHEPG